MQKIFGLLTLLFIGLSGNAQQGVEPCGTDSLGVERTEFLRSFQSDNSAYLTEDVSVLRKIPLYIHVVSKDDGTGGIELFEVLDMICRVNNQYKPVEFEFYLEGINYINSTVYWSYNSGQTGSKMMAANNVSNVVNIYIVDNPAGACGYFTPHRDAIALNINCVSSTSTTASHELGHYFSLHHTFLGWENNNTPPLSDQERVDGKNCSSAGDGFCDTPADYVSYRWSCPYNGPVLTDPVGDTVIPNPTYYMSYSSDKCQNKFSPAQMSAMKTYLMIHRSNLLNATAPSYKALADPELISPKNNEKVPFDNVPLEWKGVSGATEYYVQVSRFSSFIFLEAEGIVSTEYFILDHDLTEGRKYYWRVKPVMPANTCENFTVAESFIAGASTGIYDLESDGWRIRVYPNPVNNDEELHVQVNAVNSADAYIEIIRINGQSINQSSHQLNYGKNDFSITTDNLTSGVYLLRIIADGKQFSKRFTILK